MNSIHHTSASEPSNHIPSGIEPGDVDRALASILADDKFAAAPQMSAFLAYVVKQTLRGEADRIKAYTVAVDALGKPATFDPQNDPSVRVLAKRLRSSIEQYYARTQGHLVIIELKSGSYKPRFVLANSLDQTEATDTSDSVQHGSNGAFDARHAQIVATTDETPLASCGAAGTASTGQTRRTDVDHSGATSQAMAQEERGELVTADGPARQGGRRGLSATLRRLPHPAMIAITALAIGWGVTQQQQESRLRGELAAIAGGNAALIGDQPLQIALASSSDGQALRARPSLPTIHLPASGTQDELSGTLSASTARVFSRFENIEVIRQQPVSDEHWPEDYELHFNDYPLGDRMRVEAQLLHGATGRVVTVDTFDLPDMAQDKLTAPELGKIEAFAASLAQKNGPLIRDYLSQSDVSPAVACALGENLEALMASGKDKNKDTAGSDDMPDVETAAADPFDCERATAGGAQGSAPDLTQKADTLLGSLNRLSGSGRERSLDKALALARQAVRHEPFSAIAHTVLMNTLQEKGRHDEALAHGHQAMELNRFDATTLESVARVMDSLQLTDDSAAMRAEAMRLDPGSSSAVALNRG